MCGHRSVVERLVANEKVEGSTPFAQVVGLVFAQTSARCLGHFFQNLTFRLNEPLVWQLRCQGPFLSEMIVP